MNNMNNMDKKPTLQTLREMHHFDLTILADHANVSPQVVRKMLTSMPVQTRQAEAVLAAFNRLFGTAFTLDSVTVVVFDS